MSLLDDVSIVVTPNAYNVSTLYAVIPTPTLGAEEVTYPNFTNSDISQWKIASSRATKSWNASEFMRLTYDLASGSALYATFGHTLNVVYKVTMRVRGTKADGVTAQGSAFSSIGDNNELGRAISNPALTADWQDYEFYTVPTGSTFRFYLASAVIGDLVDFDSISVKEWTGADMDVTRETAATRVDENGLVNYAQVLGSEEVFNGDFATNISGWTTNTSRGSYAWDNGRAKITNDAADGYPNMSQDITTEIGKAYKVTATVEIGTATLAEVRIYDGAILGNQQLTSDGEIEFRFTAVGTTPKLLLYLFEAGNTGHYCYFDNVSVKQEDRNNVPRIDYTGGGCPHILAEPQRTNEETKSNEFSAWTSSSGATATANYIVSPDGTQNAARIQFTSNGFLYNTAQGNSSTLFTISCYAKRNDSGTQGVGFFVNGSGAVDSAWSLTSDWKRFTYTYTSTNTSMIGIAGLGGADISVFGFQIEKTHSYATSYIPTSGSSVTRNQDLFTRDGINSLINSTEGVLFVEMAMLSDDLTNRFISINNGSKTERVLIGYSNASNKIFASSYVGNVLQCNIFFILPDMLDYNKVALKYKENDFALWVNGVEVGTDLVGSVSTSNTFNKLALDEGDGTDIMFAKVKQLQVYKTALTDNQLIQLTGEAGTHFFESYSEMAETLTYTIQ